MKNKLKKPLLYIGFGSLVFLGFSGAISGSLAWWAFSTRASIGYSGTSVASSEQLQVGIKTKIDMRAFGMTKTVIGEDDPDTQEDESETYYFCDAGTGLQAEAIAHYLRSEGRYAIDELMPVTSGSYDEDDPLSLKSSLVSGVPITNLPAEKNKYVFIPLAFRIMRYDGSHVLTPAVGENIWLSEAVVEASSVHDGEVYKSIRMYTEGKNAVKNGNNIELVDAVRLINPSDSSVHTGQTAVAGILDLSGSGYYDTATNGNQDYVIVYGETEGDVDESQFEQWDDSEDIVDFNKVYPENTSQEAMEKSTFVSSYFPNSYHPVDVDFISPKYQFYDTLGTVKAEESSSGVLSDGKPLCATDLTTGIADLNLTIWLEGWDHHVIDKENRHSFNLGLQFMISRL